MRAVLDRWEESDAEEGEQEETRETLDAAVGSRLFPLAGGSSKVWRLGIGELGAGTTFGARDGILDNDMREEFFAVVSRGILDALLWSDPAILIISAGASRCSV